MKIRLASALFVMAGAMFAQSNTGTITVNGNVPVHSSMTDASEASLSSTISLSTLTPANNQTLVTGSNVVVRLRSNKAYTLSAQSSALSFTGAGATDNGDDLALSDIGFGVRAALTAGGDGANVANSTGTIASTFDYTSGFPTPSNGLTPFVNGTHATLANISSNTQILSGNRISKKGNLTTNNNFLQVTLGVGVLPQFFTPNTTFSATITLTLATP
jgi:hypothetical protein